MRIGTLLCCLIVNVSSPLLAQDYLVPRTEFGHPDLQGNWTNPWQTPLQRPLALGNTQSYSAEEAAVLMQRMRSLDADRRAPLDPNRAAPKAGAALNQQADGNFEIMAVDVARINGEYRTSLIINPDNGRLPYLSSYTDIYQRWRDNSFGNIDGPEIRGPLERCLSPGGPLPLMFIFAGPAGGNPAGDNPVRNIQIVQNEGYVVILSEYFSQVRIIRLDSEHIENQGDKWMGDSIARYEGDTLVIHSTHFRAEHSTGLLRNSEQLEVTETFARSGEDELLFRYTVNDPAIYSESFTAEIPLRRMADDQKLYEYGCHEGNYSMTSILRAARMAELGLL